MGNGFQFIDIIVFAMIAAFLVLRLRGVLGRRDGHEGGFRDIFSGKEEKETPESNDNGNVVSLPDQSRARTRADMGPEIEMTGDPVADGVIRIKAVDPKFEVQGFLSGARMAFEVILGAYAAGDTAALKPLLSSDVFGNFSKAIRDREQAAETMEDTLVGIKSADIVEAYMEDRLAHITVKFVSEQVNVLRGENGDVIDGDPDKIIEVTDFWTFARDTRSRNPNWTLVATRSMD